MRLALILAGFCLLASPSLSYGACQKLDLNSDKPWTFSGTLTFKVFPGPPHFTDVRSGDQPEPAYLLALDEPVCATGGDFGQDVSAPISAIHLLAPFAGDAAKVGDALRADKGRHVEVTARSIDAATTGHHHAPLLADVTAVTLDGEGMPGMERTGTTTVRGFYTALAAGDGAEAARFVIPELRTSGPFNADNMSAFYSTLRIPLTLKDVRPLGDDTFEATYGFASRSGTCDGRSIVTTTRRGDLVLIARIRSLTGC